MGITSFEIKNEDQSIWINPRILINFIVNGHDMSSWKLPKKEELKGLDRKKVTLSFSLNNHNTIMVTRFVVKTVPVDWHGLHVEVVKVFRQVEKMNFKIIEISDQIKLLDEQALSYNNRELRDEELFTLMDVNQKISEQRSNIETLEEGTLILRDQLFALLEVHHDDLYKRIYEIYLTPEGPVEIMISELITDDVLEVNPELADLIKASILSYEKREEQTEDNDPT